jgi:AraC-like DNA-binding protein
MLRGTPVYQYNPDSPSGEPPELYLQFWGKEHCSPGHAVGPGVRETFKIHFIHKGKGCVRIGEREYILTAGQAFLTYPHHVTYHAADVEEPWTYSWIGFYGERVLSVLSRTGLSPDMPIFAMDMQLMPSLYDRLTETLAHENSRDLRLQALMHDLLAVLIDSLPASSSGELRKSKQDAYVHRMLEFIHSHYSENITVRELAELLKLDRKYVSAMFKEAVGVPPRRYLLQYRMDKASELLLKGTYTVGEVARSVGYADALQFSKMFKNWKGSSPRQFAKIGH